MKKNGPTVALNRSRLCLRLGMCGSPCYDGFPRDGPASLRSAALPVRRLRKGYAAVPGLFADDGPFGDRRSAAVAWQDAVSTRYRWSARGTGSP